MEIQDLNSSNIQKTGNFENIGKTLTTIFKDVIVMDSIAIFFFGLYACYKDSICS
jgi:hypothetical protein